MSNVKIKKEKPENAFAGLGDMLAGGFDTGLMNDTDSRPMFKLADIEIEQQVREEFEDEENTLDDLGDSLLKHQIQPIVLRQSRPGHSKPYLLVAGGRRYLAAERKNMTELWGDFRPDMTDEQAAEIQFAENVQRKNLTQIEEAKRVQRDLDELGSVEAVLAKHNKNRSWLSKITALLNLPEQAKRLVKESISADLEVINNVKTIEKADPEKARELVDDLKKTRGKANAREKVSAVKDEVKPSKKAREAKASNADAPTVATTKDRSAEEPGLVSSVSTPVEILGNAYINIFEHGSNPKMILEAMEDDERAECETWLNTFYAAGVKAKDVSRAIIQGLRNGQFATDGYGAFAMAAFLYGTDSEAKFSMLNVLGSVKE